MAKTRQQVVYTEITQHEFNKHVNYVKSTIKDIRRGKYQEFITDPLHVAYLKQATTKYYLTYKIGGKWRNFVTDLTKKYEDDFEDKVVSPTRAYALFKRFVKFKDDTSPVNVVSPFSYYNPKYVNNRYENCIGYDMNNARLASCKNLLIPYERINEYRAPREGEVGFLFDGKPIYGPSTTKCRDLFKCKIDANLNKWVDYVSNKILEDKAHWKKVHNYSIGMLRRHNIFIYNCIMYKENTVMSSLIDENSLWSTTDSIVSLVEGPDIPISTIVGEFKIEHKGSFAYTEHGYQWNTDTPTIKGFSKGKVELYNETHKDKFDILKKDITYVDKIRYKVKDGYIVDEQEQKI